MALYVAWWVVVGMEPFLEKVEGEGQPSGLATLLGRAGQEADSETLVSSVCRKDHLNQTGNRDCPKTAF